ncbi:MAG: hypothetical protein ABIR96_05065 [Bdellovibrionota bacterium]
MFAVIYKFSVKDGLEDQFKNAWHSGTAVIYKKLGSLGSRMHLSETGEWIAYAVWPSKEIFERKWDLTEEESETVFFFKQFCTNVELVHKLNARGRNNNLIFKRFIGDKFPTLDFF